MSKKQIVSVYEVTDLKTGKQERVFIEGDGERAARFIRKEYPRLTKFVLEGFEINGNFATLKLRR